MSILIGKKNLMTMHNPTGRTRDYVKCWNCDGYIGKNIVQRDDFDNECPLCYADPLVLDK